jgi:hypothetical protein
MKNIVPVDARRQDWPRLVANAINDSTRRVAALETGSSGGSGTFLIDDGTASGGGVFSFDEGGA